MVTAMKVKRIGTAGISRPFGDAREVTQAFPSAASPQESDPFLMCDYMDSREMDEKAKDEDDFPFDWHPHRGFDIATYLRVGTGRHADSLGNRGTYASPGLQWMSTGSGVYHAEGGANARGERMQGFQIWINVPGDKKMEDPRYGTVQPEEMPTAELGGGSTARVLAGEFRGLTGSFTTVQPVQMVDFDLPAGSGAVSFDVTGGFETALLYVYDGTISVGPNGGVPTEPQSVVVMDATDAGRRTVEMRAGPRGACVMLFAGKRINQPIKWHGPIVMTNDYDLRNTFNELWSGRFPPVCVRWNYKKLAARPTDQCIPVKRVKGQS